MQQRLAAVIVGVLLGLPNVTLAQESSGLESVSTRVKPGSKVAVITTDGQQLRGRFDRPTASDLTVSVLDKTTVVPATKVARVIAHDSDANGIVAGAMGGALFGLLAGFPIGESLAEGGDTGGAVAVGFAALGAGAGAAIGWAIDRARHPVVYREGAHVTFRPHLSSFTPAGATKAGTRAGVRATIVW